MKKLVIGLFVLGLTNLSFSQNTNNEKNVQLEDVVITNINLSYLETVQDMFLPAKVISLQNKASNFDVKTLQEFDGRLESFIVEFKGYKGFIIAEYDKNGKIVKTSERYREVKIPINLTKQVLLQYPECKFLKVAYMVKYQDQKNVEKVYKIQIMDQGKKRNLKINSPVKLNDAITISSIK